MKIRKWQQTYVINWIAVSGKILGTQSNILCPPRRRWTVHATDMTGGGRCSAPLLWKNYVLQSHKLYGPPQRTIYPISLSADYVTDNRSLTFEWYTLTSMNVAFIDMTATLKNLREYFFKCETRKYFNEEKTLKKDRYPLGFITNE